MLDTIHILPKKKKKTVLQLKNRVRSAERILIKEIIELMLLLSQLYKQNHVVWHHSNSSGQNWICSNTIADEIVGGGREAGTNYRDVVVRRGPTMLYMVLYFSAVLCVVCTN